MPDGAAFAPHPLTDFESEAELLSGLLRRPAAWADIAETGLRAEMFATAGHPEIFEAILARADCEHDVTSVVTVELGAADPQFRGHVSRLVMHGGFIAAPYLRDRAQAVVQLHRRRQAIEVADRLRDQARRPEGEMPIAAALADAASDLEALSASAVPGRGIVTIGQAFDEMIADTDRRGASERLPIFGIPALDDAIVSLEAGGVYPLGARPGTGKSALALQAAETYARSGRSVGFLSLEMSAPQQVARLAAHLANVNPQAIRRGHLREDERDRFQYARREIEALRISFADAPAQSISAIALHAKAIRRRHGLDLLIVDHLHLVEAERDDKRLGATWAVGTISRGLKRLAKDLAIPILALAQLNRASALREDKRPTLADLRQSGDIEQDAEAVLLLHRAEMYFSDDAPERRSGEAADKYDERVAAFYDQRRAAKGRAELIIAKNRHGPCATVELGFDATFIRFTESG